MTVSNSATSCCQGGCQPRRPASDRQAVYLDQCYGKHLMCSASNVFSARYQHSGPLSAQCRQEYQIRGPADLAQGP